MFPKDMKRNLFFNVEKAVTHKLINGVYSQSNLPPVVYSD